jgi:hypothetical protein
MEDSNFDIQYSNHIDWKASGSISSKQSSTQNIKYDNQYWKISPPNLSKTLLSSHKTKFEKKFYTRRKGIGTLLSVNSMNKWAPHKKGRKMEKLFPFSIESEAKREKLYKELV